MHWVERGIVGCIGLKEVYRWVHWVKRAVVGCIGLKEL